MEYIFKGDIPDGEYCENCRFLVGEIPVCFITEETLDEEIYQVSSMNWNSKIRKCDECPNPKGGDK